MNMQQSRTINCDTDHHPTSSQKYDDSKNVDHAWSEYTVPRAKEHRLWDEEIGFPPRLAIRRLQRMTTYTTTQCKHWLIDWAVFNVSTNTAQVIWETKDPTNSIKILKEKTLQKPRRRKEHKIQQYNKETHTHNPLVYNNTIGWLQ